MIEIARSAEGEIAPSNLTDSEEWTSDAEVMRACRNPLMQQALRQAFGRDIATMARPRDFMVFSLGQGKGRVPLVIPPLFSVMVPAWVPVIGGKVLKAKAISERCFVALREGKLMVEFEP